MRRSRSPVHTLIYISAWISNLIHIKQAGEMAQVSYKKILIINYSHYLEQGHRQAGNLLYAKFYLQWKLFWWARCCPLLISFTRIRTHGHHFFLLVLFSNGPSLLCNWSEWISNCKIENEVFFSPIRIIKPHVVEYPSLSWFQEGLIKRHSKI